MQNSSSSAGKTLRDNGSHLESGDNNSVLYICYQLYSYIKFIYKFSNCILRFKITFLVELSDFYTFL